MLFAFLAALLDAMPPAIELPTFKTPPIIEPIISLIYLWLIFTIILANKVFIFVARKLFINLDNKLNRYNIMSKDDKPKARQTKEGGVKSPGRPRKTDAQKEDEANRKALLEQKRNKGIQKGDRQIKNRSIANKIRTFVNAKYEDMEEAFDQIEDPAVKVKLWLDALNYVMPKMRSVEFQGDEGKTTLEAKMMVLVGKTTDEIVTDVEHEEME